MLLPIGLIWVIAILYPLLAPRSYESEWTLLLPGTGVGTAVNLESIGQASSSVSSSYTSQALDPKKNYQAIAASEPVLAWAASALGLHRSQLRPQVKTREQTAVIEFSVRRETPEQAQEAGRVLLEAFEETLAKLRADEIVRRESASVAFIEGYRARVDETQHALLAFQRENTTLSTDQFESMLSQVLELEQELRTVQADIDARAAALDSLIAVLGLSPTQASVALRLETDPVLAPVLQSFGQARAQLAMMGRTWGPNHPERRNLELQRDAAAAHLSNAIPQVPIARIAELSLRTEGGQSSQQDRSALFASLIRLSSEREAEQARAHRVAFELAALTERLEAERQTAAKVDSLTREHQVASAVFSSALAKVDLGKSDPYASYPLVQVLMQPTLPERHATPNSIIVAIGALFGSLLVCAGFLIWNLIEKRPEVLGLKPRSSGSSR